MTDAVRQGQFSQVRVASPTRPLGGTLKRCFDVLAAAAGLVLLAPLFLMIAALVRFHDGGPCFYGHRRIGTGGREFRCLKFRTMVQNGDEVLSRHLSANPGAAEEWSQTRKLRFDPRVTSVGRVLRALSIDELPQLLNVIMGDMSLVGPRPVVQEELERYGAYATCYLRTRPGITGLWQVSGRNDVSYEDRVSFDAFYFSNWSLYFDLKIIFMTVPAVMLSRGSY